MSDNGKVGPIILTREEAISLVSAVQVSSQGDNSDITFIRRIARVCDPLSDLMIDQGTIPETPRLTKELAAMSEFELQQRREVFDAVQEEADKVLLADLPEIEFASEDFDFAMERMNAFKNWNTSNERVRKIVMALFDKMEAAKATR